MIKLYKTVEKNEKIKAVIADLRNADSKPSDSFFENFERLLAPERRILTAILRIQTA